jgi:hypothetical protein
LKSGASIPMSGDIAVTRAPIAAADRGMECKSCRLVTGLKEMSHIAVKHGG